jgi:hypothetical protein
LGTVRRDALHSTIIAMQRSTSHPPGLTAAAPAAAPVVSSPLGRAKAAASPRGHALAAIPLRPTAPVLASPPTPIQLSRASASTGSGVIQRAPWWKRGLAGLGVVGGGLALALGAPVTGTLGLLAGGGYLAHRAWQRRQPGGTERQALEDHRDQLSGSREGTRQRLLHDILSEGLGQLGTTTEISPVPSRLGGGDTGRNGRRGRYTVRLDPNERDPITRQSYLLHELTHVSSDRVYGGNADGGGEFYNIDQPLGGGRSEDHPEYGRLYGLADQLYTTADQDPHLSDAQRDHIKGRAGYLAMNPLKEHDTVMTDLLYYAHVHGISERSPTHQAIVQQARAAYQARQR